MEISTPGQKPQNNASEWHLLGEYVLSEQIIDEEVRGDLTTGSLLQTIQELGLPLACLNNVKETLADCIKATRGLSVSGKPAFQVHIRLFYQRRSPEGKTSMQGLQAREIKQPIDLTQANDTSHFTTNGGWGYFLIERGVDSVAVSSTHPKDCIDLYLYKEGQ
jgi:hypothetical protein